MLAKTRTERNIRVALDDRFEKDRQLGRAITIVAIKEHHYIGSIRRRQSGKACPSISAPRFRNNPGPQLRRDFRGSVTRIAVNHDNFRNQIRRKIC